MSVTFCCIPVFDAFTPSAAIPGRLPAQQDFVRASQRGYQPNPKEGDPYEYGRFARFHGRTCLRLSLPGQDRGRRALRCRRHPRLRAARQAGLPVLHLVRRGHEFPHHGARVPGGQLRPVVDCLGHRHRRRLTARLDRDGHPVPDGRPARRRPADPGPRPLGFFGNFLPVAYVNIFAGIGWPRSP